MKKIYTLLVLTLTTTLSWAQTETLTITRSNFPTGSLVYGTDDLWIATTSSGEEIQGYFDLFSSATQTTMQTRINTPIGSHPYNTIAIPGNITKITLTGGGTGSARTWTPYLSSNPLTKENYTTGDIQQSQTAADNSASTIWEIDSEDNYTYFYLNMTGGAAYLNTIIIEYEAEEETPEPVEPTATFASESLSGFTYIEAQGPSTSQSVVVNVTDLTSENTLSVVSLNTNFEVVNAPSLVNGANTIEIRLASGLEAGEYTGEVQVTLGETTLDTITLTGEVTDAPLSNVSNDIEGLRIYPNPANDVVTISTNSSAVKSVQMFDISGKQVLNVDTDSTINVSTLSKGIYVVKIVEEGKTSTSKLVIK